MKKFLVILMVVAMASFLFVGCIPTTPEETAEEEEEEEVVVVATSATPVLTAVETSAAVSIFDVTSTSTLYMNKAEAGSSILVKGTAPSESLVTIYLDDVAIASAVGETAVTGLWTVAIAESSLGADGAGKKLHATVTEVGLAESAASNSVTFTLDTVLPSATTLAATANAVVGATGGTATVTTGGTATATTTGVLAGVTAGNIVTGTWTINILGITGVAANVSITNPAGTVSTYSQVAGGEVFAAGAPIPGVPFTLATPIAAGQTSTITCLAQSAAIADRARVLFSEEITSASAILLANYVFSTAAVVNVPTAVSYADKYMYFSPMVTATLVSGNTLACSVNGVVDLAGNIQTTASALTCTVTAASLTSLKP